jgi:hypothetical protein
VKCKVLFENEMYMAVIHYQSSLDGELVELINNLPGPRNYRIRLDAFYYFSDSEFKARYRLGLLKNRVL